MSDGRVEWDIRGDHSQLGGDLDAAADKIAKKTAKWTVIGQAALNGIMAVGKAVGNGVKQLITNAVEYNSQMEQYTTSFETMLGSTEAAQAKVAELKKYAAETPFAMTDLADATKTMLSFGISNEKATAALKMLGDISQGDSEKLRSLSLAFAQISSTGKLTGQDLLQMVNAGFNPLQSIASKTGASIGDLKEAMAGGKGSKEFQAMVKKAQAEVKKLGDKASDGAKMLAQIGTEGQISAELVTQAMQDATSEGGLFFGAMEKQSKTFAGQLATLKDDFAALNAEVFGGVTDALAKNIMPLAQGYLKQLEAGFKKGGVSGLVKTLGSVLGDAVSKAAVAAPKILKVINSVISSLVGALRDNSSTIATGLADTLAVAVEGLADVLPELVDAGVDMAITLVTALADKLPELIPKATTALLDTLLLLLDDVDALVDAGIAIVTGLVDGIIAAIPILIEKAPEILKKLIQALVSGFNKIVDSGANILAKIWTALSGDETTPEQVKQFFRDLWSDISDYAREAADVGAGVLADIWSALSGQETTKDEVKSFFQEMWDRLKESTKEFTDQGGDALSTIWAALEGDSNAKLKITNFFKEIWDNIGKSATAIWNDIIGVINTAIAKTKEFLGINSNVSNVKTGSSGIKHGTASYDTKFASGGIVSGGARLLSRDGSPTYVGEAGAEAIMPLDLLWSHMGALMDSRLSAVTSIPRAVTVQGPSMDPAALARAIWDMAPENAFGGPVYLDGDLVGRAVSGMVSQHQANSYYSLERSGWSGDLPRRNP